MEYTHPLLQAKEILKIHVRNKHKELWGVPIRRQMMSVLLDKCEASKRVRRDNQSAQDANETDVVNEPKKVTPGKGRHDRRNAGETEMQVDAIRSEPKLAEPGQGDIALEVLQTTPGGNSSFKLETPANEAENSSDGEICTKNRTLETSDPIPSEVKKRKRVEQGGDDKVKSKIGKKIKAEAVEERNIKDEVVQRLKILQKGVKSRKFFFFCETNPQHLREMNFSDCLYLQANQMARLCSAAGSSAQNGDFSQNLRILHW